MAKSKKSLALLKFSKNKYIIYIKTKEKDKTLEELLDKAKNGDKEAYEELVNELYKYLYCIAKDKLDDEDDIKDAIQETLIKFDKHYMKIRESRAVKKWTKVVLKNKCNDIIKSNKKIEKLVDKLEMNIDLTEDELDRIEYNFKDNSILEVLNDKERAIVLLRYMEDCTIAQICKNLNENENTVKSNLHRAKAKLLEHNKKKVLKLSMVLVAIVLLTSSVTFGGKIIDNLKEKVTMFQITSIQGIEDAISNDFAEDVDSEFVNNNGVSMKPEKIAMDDKLLYISYLFNFEENLDVTSIELEKYSIIDDKNNVLSVEIDRDLNKRFGSDYSSGGVTYSKTEVREDGKLSYATIFQVIHDKNYPISNKIIVNIEKISAVVNGERKYFDGNWNFEIDLKDKFSKRSSEYFACDVDEKLKRVSAKLNDLSLEIVIEFNEKINEEVANSNDIILQNEIGEIIEPYSKIVNRYANKITYICDVGKFTKDIDKLNLYMKYNYGKDGFIDIDLKR